MKKPATPYTTDAYGNSFYSMSLERLVELRDAVRLEVSTYSFYKESIRYQKKQRATLELLTELAK